MRKEIEDDLRSIFDDADYIHDNLYVGLQKETADPALVKKPGPFKGTEQYLYIRGTKQSGCAWRVKVNETVLEKAGICKKDAWNKACRNTFSKGRTLIHTMPGILKEMGCPLPVLGDAHLPMFVITNPKKHYGAVQVLDKKAIRTYFNNTSPDVKKCVVIPSSVHECLLVPDEGTVELEYFNEMVISVNDSCVDPSEQLSDSCFILSLDGNDEVY